VKRYNLALADVDKNKRNKKQPRRDGKGNKENKKASVSWLPM
jgi:hypothetical protein